jgi:alcohol dehydrogenase YqhD (iron-dependent ADH family)
MYRAIPEGNKILSRRWREKDREIHQSKLSQMKPTVEIREPASFAHLQKKLKKNQMQEGKRAIYNHILERYTEIERENRILLEKMTHIM